MIAQAWMTTPDGKRRGRGLGLPFPGTPGVFNAITDVAGIEVGYTTLISGDGALVRGSGPVRTGVTAILARGKAQLDRPCMAGAYSLNGNGEMTGLAWIEEAGQLEAPITITNTHSCGVTRDATIRWLNDMAGDGIENWSLPVAAETYDGELNDINGFHVTVEHTCNALNTATGGALELGSVGGGTGMSTYEFKAGSGSSSRRVTVGGDVFTVGCFVQSNFGLRHELTVLGVPVGRELTGGEFRSVGSGSIIAVIATDAPLMPHQLKRLARRVPLGLARTGTVGHNGSGDIFLAFSTANFDAFAPASRIRQTIDCIANGAMDPLFAGVVETVEEAVIDSMIANDTMTGANGLTVRALPHDHLLELLKARGVDV